MVANATGKRGLVDAESTEWAKAGARIAEERGLASISLAVISEDDGDAYIRMRLVDMDGEAETWTRNEGER